MHESSKGREGLHRDPRRFPPGRRRPHFRFSRLCRALAACLALLVSVPVPISAQEGLPEGLPDGLHRQAAGSALPPGAVSTLSSGSSLSTPASARAKLGRLFVISAGSFPFTWFYSNFLFDLVRFARNDYSAAYAPWPFKSQNSAAVESAETFQRLGAALGASLAVGFIDLIL